MYVEIISAPLSSKTFLSSELKCFQSDPGLLLHVGTIAHLPCFVSVYQF